MNKYNVGLYLPWGNSQVFKKGKGSEINGDVFATACKRTLFG